MPSGRVARGAGPGSTSGWRVIQEPARTEHKYDMATSRQLELPGAADQPDGSWTSTSPVGLGDRYATGSHSSDADELEALNLDRRAPTRSPVRPRGTHAINPHVCDHLAHVFV